MSGSQPEGALAAIGADYGGLSSEDEEMGEGKAIIVKEELLIDDGFGDKDVNKGDGDKKQEPQPQDGFVPLPVKEEEKIVDQDVGVDVAKNKENSSVDGQVDDAKIKMDVDMKEEFEGDSYLQFRDALEGATEDSEPDSDSDGQSQGQKVKRKLKPKKRETDISTSDDEEEWDLSTPDDDGKPKEAPRVRGEMKYQDLPPIEDLQISVPHDKAKPIGVIKSVVDPLVIVEAYPNIPALDIDSVLFLDQGDRTLGAIFDVIGQVKQPFYCVRFNSLEHISSRGVEKGMLVYCAPSTPHTSYVLLAQLQQMKGTDASWLDDVEPPAEVNEYSDDETERVNKKKRNRKARVRNNATNAGATPGTFQQPRGFNPRRNFRQFPPNFNNYYPPQQQQDYSWHTHRLFHPQQQQYQQYSAYQMPPPPTFQAPAYRYRHPHVQQANWNYPQPTNNKTAPPPPPPPPRNPPPPGT